MRNRSSDADLRSLLADDIIQVGLEQMLHHIGAHCKRLTEADLGAAAGSASRGGTARTCLQEVVQLVGALQGSPAWGRHTVLRQRCGAAAQVLLLHLVKVCSYGVLYNFTDCNK